MAVFCGRVGEKNRETKAKVRKKLRSTAQLLAHLAAGLERRGFQRCWRRFSRCNCATSCAVWLKAFIEPRRTPQDRTSAACGSSCIWNAFLL